VKLRAEAGHSIDGEFCPVPLRLSIDKLRRGTSPEGGGLAARRRALPLTLPSPLARKGFQNGYRNHFTAPVLCILPSICGGM
jgi:hypothetical protein